MVLAKPQRILAWEPESEEAFEYFSTIHWYRRHLITYPELRPFKVDYANRKAHGWDPVVSGLLARPDAAGIRHFLSTLADPGQLPQLDHPLNAAQALGLTATTGGDVDRVNKTRLYAATVPPTPPGPNPFPQHVNFYTLGADLAGIPTPAFAQLGFVHADPRGQFYSAFTNVRFLRPIIIPPAPALTTTTTQQQQQQQQGSPLSSAAAAATVVGGNQSDSGQGGVANVIVRAQIDSIATKEGDDKMHVMAQVETEGGVICAIGGGLGCGEVVEKLHLKYCDWKRRVHLPRHPPLQHHEQPDARDVQLRPQRDAAVVHGDDGAQEDGEGVDVAVAAPERPDAAEPAQRPDQQARVDEGGVDHDAGAVELLRALPRVEGRDLSEEVVEQRERERKGNERKRREGVVVGGGQEVGARGDRNRKSVCEW
ncbi:hypothetical protein PG994_003003 [Apiospora phragmitis]|uniref:Uncharacterized protein n=1 Tax=Apiospora phragmitis TaxID=2905665 RepID=A0ABR1W6T8_9PEZI